MINGFTRRIKDYLLKLPLMTWVLLGFFLTFLFFFILPVFFDPSQSMQFKQYILVQPPIGHDFRAVVDTSSTWLHSGSFLPIAYPAFTFIFFAPFTLLDVVVSYKIFVLAILAGYVMITLVLPMWIHKQKSISALAMLIFVSGMVSYGLQFELERGQENVIAILFCLAAIWLFHEHPKRRWLAYLLFTVAVQIKLYPAIFIFMLIDDWQDWRNTIKRWVGLGILNVLALFILGWIPVLNMVSSQGYVEASHVGRQFNLSISSFTLNLLSLRFLPHKRIILWLQANSWLPQLFLFAFFAVCFLVILRQVYKGRSKGFNPYVFMACTIGAFIIPAISFDYKLAVFPAAVVLSIPAIQSFEGRGNRSLVALLTFLFSAAYSSTLYPYVNKPAWLQYNLPALFLILIICTVACCFRPDENVVPLSDSPEAQFKEP
jgi:hypothetical protein